MEGKILLFLLFVSIAGFFWTLYRGLCMNQSNRKLDIASTVLAFAMAIASIWFHYEDWADKQEEDMAKEVAELKERMKGAETDIEWLKKPNVQKEEQYD